VLNRVLGTRFKVVEGYTGTPQIFLAIERGEVEGMCHSWSVFESSHADTIWSGKIKILFHLGESAFPDMPDVPSVFAHANTEQKQYLRFVFSGAEFGRPFVAPPGVPEERLQVLRRAFRNMTEDPAFLAAAEKAKLDVRLRTPQDLMALVEELFATPQEQITRIKAVMPQMRD
jgi:tripartite-type tricarboxylate transporter receptor subunit TctC